MDQLGLSAESLYDIKQGYFSELSEQNQIVGDVTRQIAQDPKEVDGSHIEKFREVGFTDAEIIEFS